MYDQVRSIDSAKRRGKALKNVPVVVSELVFAQPDDPLIMGTARQMLSATAGWDAPALAPRGDVKSGVEQSGGVDDVLAVPDVRDYQGRC